MIEESGLWAHDAFHIDVDYVNVTVELKRDTDIYESYYSDPAVSGKLTNPVVLPSEEPDFGEFLEPSAR